MTKTVIMTCDLCGKETPPENMMSKFMYAERKFFGAKGSPQSELVPEQKDFCIDCTEKIKVFIVKQQAECQKKST